MAAFHHWTLDVIDILAVSFIVYRLLILTRGTRAAQMLLGLVLLFGISVISDWLQLNGLNWLFSNLETVWAVAFVILFQPELRRGLAQVGQNPVLRFFLRYEVENEATQEIVKAATELARNRHGALIVIADDQAMRPYIETGTRVDARVTSELLVSIFSPRGPLHDGAAIVQEDRLVAARCLLPVSEKPNLPARFGLRHRAAMGLTEETDATVIVVSEERGDITVIHRELANFVKTEEELRQALLEVSRKETPPPRSRWRRPLRRPGRRPGRRGREEN